MPLASLEAMRRSHVLIVDDNAALARSLARVLAKTNTVEVSTSAKAAVERFEKGDRFDVVLADLLLGEEGMNGVDLMHTVARLDAEQAARFVLMTGQPLSDDEQTRLGAPVLVKPFAIDTLTKVIGLTSAGHHRQAFDHARAANRPRRRQRATSQAKA